MTRKNICKYVLMISSIFLSAQKINGQNLVNNGDFTLSATNWTSFAPATGTEAYNPETSYGGTVGTNIIAEIDNGANLRQVNIPVIAGTTYELSFRRTRRTIGGAPNPTGIRVKVYDGPITFLTQDVFSNNTTWAWTCENFTFTPTTNTISLDFENITTVISTLGTIIDDVTISPQQQTIALTGTTCQGGTISLAAPPNSAGAIYSNFSWTGPNGFTANTQSITFNNAQPTLNGVYTCTMTLNGCMSVTGTYNLQVSPNNFTIVENICIGSTYYFYGRLLFEPGTYDTLIVGNNNACDSFITLQLNVNPLPDVSTSHSGNVDICIGDTVKLNVLNPTTNNTYQWLKNDVVATGETGTTYAIYESATYNLTALTNNGCRDTSADILVQVHTPPEAKIKLDLTKPLCLSDTIAISSTATAYYYYWEPQYLFRNHSFTGMQEKMVMGMLRDNETMIHLRTYDANGCFSTDSLKVLAKACCDLFIPDAFSPNGDGNNDYFFPNIDRGQLLTTFQIFDRWGKLVYSGTKVFNKGWDGRYPDGTVAPAGVYMYYLQYTCGNQALQVKKGDLTLIY